MLNVSVTDGEGAGNATVETSPSPVFEDAACTVTSAEGWLVSRIVNVAVVPFSDVWPEMAETVNPATSLSEIVTVAVDGLMTV